MLRNQHTVLAKAWSGLLLHCLIVAVVLALMAAPASVAFADHGTPNDSPPDKVSTNSAIIDNGTVQIGVLDQGHLGVGGGIPASDSTNTRIVGVRYVPTNGESTSQGCICEGWGVADAGTSQFAYANVSSGGIVGITLDSFSYAGSGNPIINSVGSEATSVVTAFGRLRVTHHFHPTPLTPNLYQVDVSIENISATPVNDLRYTRVMDWDISPTPFREFVTIQGFGSAADLLYVDDNGFVVPNPLGSRSPRVSGAIGNIIDSGPADHGAGFDFGFGSLAPGAIKQFRIYYGAAGTESGALSALLAVGAEAFSLGQPNTADGPSLGTPNTFVFAFSGIGGAVLIPPALILAPSSATVEINLPHTLVATVIDDNDDPVPNVNVTFEVVSGPNMGVLGTGTTDTLVHRPR